MTIPWETFSEIIRPTFGTIGKTQFLAVLKRFNIFIAGTHGMAVRPASDSPTTPVYMFTADSLGDDWLKPDHKFALNAFERGEFVKYEGWDTAVKDEQDMVRRVQDATKHMMPEDIVKWWVQRVENSRRPIPAVPATPMGEDSQTELIRHDFLGSY